MKSLFALALFLALSLNASAAVLQLDSGDVVTLSPNVYTTVSCNGSGGSSSADCDDKAEKLTKILTTCKSPQNSGSDQCILTLWPSWKSDNPGCETEGSLACMEYCKWDSNWCAKNCI